ncbi:MAG: 1,4-alpha-glucan branching protein GlgB [Polyangiaceae bacterium]|nr:1,4-alpha-glucan branching protein GlgB [Polyangiaceae bacterium]
MGTPHDFDRIARNVHPDPHSVLGPHVEDGALTIRVFRPDATEVRILPLAAHPVTLASRIRPEGLFQAMFPGVSQHFPYRVEVRTQGGTITFRDPYSFPPALGDVDYHLFAEGTHEQIFRHLGAHVREIDGVTGTSFAVWAPFASRVSVAGDFNQWDGRIHPMRQSPSGVWEIFLPDVRHGALYKFEVRSSRGVTFMKVDPFANAFELRPNNAAKVYERRYQFTDQAWMEARRARDPKDGPMSIYEVHLGSWRRKTPAGEPSTDPAAGFPTYRELADQLIDYVAEMGFSHIELLPVMEHPYDGSWGYQVAGYYAPTARYGEPDDLRYFIDRAHARGIGVIVDWVPAHFPKDAWALGRFDGTALFEHLDPRQGEHAHWNTFIFNYGRPEVKNFLVANALYWLEEFHADGLRVDAVASMLYLDYGKGPGQWVPNKFGGRENLDAIAFLRDMNERVATRFPGVVVCAEESTSWPGVTRPTYLGGLGFSLKWNMGWMHDTLNYFSMDSIFRSFHHNLITFGLMYAFTENFLLPLSHDEVVHLKKSLLSKMPGDWWRQRANLRALYGYMWAHPGKKLLFMGGEIGQYTEWNEAAELQWGVLNSEEHRGLQRLVRDLNHVYTARPALWEEDRSWEGFEWIDANDAHQSVAAFVRYAKNAKIKPPPPVVVEPESPEITALRLALIETERVSTSAAGAAEGVLNAAPETGVLNAAPTAEASADPAALVSTTPAPVDPLKAGPHVVIVGNFTPIPRYGYRIGVPSPGRYSEIVNTDAREYGGSGMGNLGVVDTSPVPAHGFAQSIVLTLPPLAVLYLEHRIP